MPYGDQVNLKKSLSLIPATIGKWTGYEELQEGGNSRSHEDQYLYRRYINTNGQSLFLYIGYWGKFKQDADIFSGNHIAPGFLWDPVSEKDISIELQGKKYPVKEIVYVNGNDYISIIYWYHTNRGVSTRRFSERLVNGIDAVLNRRTNVALVKITSMPYLNSMPYEAVAGQAGFTEKIIPLLTDFLPFD